MMRRNPVWAAWLTVTLVAWSPFAIAEQCDRDFQSVPVTEELKQSAGSGDVRDQIALAVAYLQRNDPGDNDHAVSLLEQVAVADNAQAAYLLGVYFSQKKDSKGEEKSVQWFNTAAGLGCTPAMDRLAEDAIAGRGGPKDPEAGERLLEKAASLGDMYARMLMGERKLAAAKSEGEADEAMKMLSAAYRNGDTTSGMILALATLHPKFGAPDANFARRILIEVFQKNDRNKVFAADALGQMYMDGDGVPQDDSLAYQWLAFPAKSRGVPPEVLSRYQKVQDRLVKKYPAIVLTKSCEVHRRKDLSDSGEFTAVPGEAVSILNRSDVFLQALFPDRKSWGYISPACS